MLEYIYNRIFKSESRQQSSEWHRDKRTSTCTYKRRGIDYCEILSTATKGDEESIRELLLLEIYDAAGYDHGAVIVDLIKIVGEDKVIRAIEAMNCEQKTSITSYIEAGLQYGNNPNSAKQELNDIFPDVYNSLKC